MKTTSADYKAAMAEDMRGQAFCKITVQNINYDEADDSSAWSITTGGLEFGGSSDWNDSLNEKNYQYQTWATLELNRWTLDSSQRPVFDSSMNNGGYVSDLMSDASGAFTAGSRPTLERTFADGSYSTQYVNVLFDTAVDYPITVSFNYKYIDGGGTEQTAGAVQYTITGGEFAFPTQEADGSPRDVSYLYFRAVTALPYRRFRIRTVWFGSIIEFDNGVIQEIVQTNDVDPLSRRLPQNECGFSIIDFDGVWDMENPASFVHYLYDRVPVSVQYGMTLADNSVEWLDPDYYYIVSKPTYDNGIASFEAVGILNTMTDTFYGGTFDNNNTYSSIAETVLTDANLPLVDGGASAWDISTMNDGHTSRVMPEMTHAECLQVLAHAKCNRLYTNDKNQIVIEPFTYNGLTPNGYQLDYDSISINTQILSLLDMVHNCMVHYYLQPLIYQPVFKPVTSVTVVSGQTQYSVGIDGDYLAVTPDDILIRNHSIVEYSSYKNRTEFTIDPLLLPDGSVIRIFGAAAPVYQDNIFTLPVNIGGVDDTEDNTMIDRESDAQTLAYHVSGYLQLRRTYDMEYRGDPALETGDVIEVQVKYTNTLLKAYVLCNELSYNGAFHGKVTVKILDN